MDLLLNHQLLRASLATWREAIVMTTEPADGRRAAGNLQELVQVLRGAIQKTDGCLAVLTACEVQPAHKGAFDELVSELRTFKAWLEQGLMAASVMKTGQTSVGGDRA